MLDKLEEEQEKRIQAQEAEARFDQELEAAGIKEKLE